MVNNVYFTIPEGSLMVNVISSTSFTSGSETNEESHIAKNIKPKLPYGCNVCLSQIDIASKFINKKFWGNPTTRT
jgi:hypothetical protein